MRSFPLTTRAKRSGERKSKRLPPLVDKELVKDDIINLVVQVNGKLRGEIKVSVSATKDEIEKLALADENVKRFVEDKPVRKVIVVPKRLVNIVV